MEPSMNHSSLNETKFAEMSASFRPPFEQQEKKAVKKLTLESEGGLVPVDNVRRLANCVEVVCRIYHPKPARRGTGFLIGPGLLLTNNHVLRDKQDAREAHAQFFYEKGRSDVIEVNFNPDEEQGGWFYTSPEPSENLPFEIGKLDFTIVALKAHPKLDRIYQLGLSIFSQSFPEVNGRANIIQHPLIQEAGKGETSYKQWAFRGNRILKVKKHKFVVQYRTTTAPGSSGSPVLDDKGDVFAIHNTKCSRTDREGKDEVQYNEAILIQAIVEELKQQNLIEKVKNWICPRPLDVQIGNPALQKFAAQLNQTAAKAEEVAERNIRQFENDTSKIIAAHKSLRCALIEYSKLGKLLKNQLSSELEAKKQKLVWQEQRINFLYTSQHCLLPADRSDFLVEMLKGEVEDTCPATEFKDRPMVETLLGSEYHSDSEAVNYFIKAFIHETLENKFEAKNAYYSLAEFYYKNFPSEINIIKSCIEKWLSLEEKEALNQKKAFLHRQFKAKLRELKQVFQYSPTCYIYYDCTDETEAWIERTLSADLDILDWKHFFRSRASDIPGVPTLRQHGTLKDSDFVFALCTPMLALKDNAYRTQNLSTLVGKLADQLAERIERDGGDRQHSVFPLLLKGEWDASALSMLTGCKDYQWARTDEEYYICMLSMICRMANMVHKRNTGEKGVINVKDALNDWKKVEIETLLNSANEGEAGVVVETKKKSL
ncbi:serine protease [Neochlamydia sp. AcF95]|uniref:trypsin-like serine peptidase n=1 Tax=Neochlamydia sp. AcF95 TaxID=2795734 RepID=UPI001BCA4F3A|nr:serine protease [Neochlamydia sp. AcF95]